MSTAPLRVPKNGPAQTPAHLRCMQHFRGLVARNLRLPQKLSLLNCYYSLHELTLEGTVGESFYVSEVIYNTLVRREETFWAFDGLPCFEFIVCIWNCSGNSATCIITVPVILANLSFIESEEEIRFPQNTVLFLLTDGLYASQGVRRALISDRQIIPLNAYELKAELKARGTKISFTREEFQNLAQKQDVLRESEEKLVVLSTAVEQKLREKREYFDFVTKRNEAEDELEALRTLLEQKKAENAAARQKIGEISAQLLPRAERLKEAELSLLAKRQLLDKEKDEKEENFEKYKAITGYLQRNTLHLIHELGQIFKIERLTPPRGTYQEGSVPPVRWTICKFYLPHSNFDGCDEDHTAIALGHVCHLLFMLAKYLDVPLRYPLNPRCSRSTLTDTITTKGQYPLYSRGVDSARFQYAVFLLNKNVEQLIESQQDCGIKVKSLRETLPNLYRLMMALERKRKDTMRGKPSGPIPRRATTNVVTPTQTSTPTTPTSGSFDDSSRTPGVERRHDK